MVEVDSLSKVYLPSPLWIRALVRAGTSEPVIALDEISTTVRAGQTVVVLGPNGAGKTTLFRILAGLTTSSSGTSRILGMSTAEDAPSVRRRIGFMGTDDRALLLRHSCIENLKFHGRLQGYDERGLASRIREVLEIAGLTDVAGRTGFALSAGMRARLQFARAILARPSVLILDEPTATIDPVTAHDLLALVRAVATADGIAVLLSSHRVEEVGTVGDEILLLNRGRIVHSGTVDSFRARWDSPRIRLTFVDETACTRAAEILTQFGSASLSDGRSLHLTTPRAVGDILASLGPNLTSVTRAEPLSTDFVDLLRSALDEDLTQRNIQRA